MTFWDVYLRSIPYQALLTILPWIDDQVIPMVEKLAEILKYQGGHTLWMKRVQGFSIY